MKLPNFSVINLFQNVTHKIIGLEKISWQNEDNSNVECKAADYYIANPLVLEYIQLLIILRY